MQLGKISLRPAQTAQGAASDKASAQSSAAQKFSSNPFGVSFKGNVMQADVFQSSAGKTAVSGIGEKGRLFAGAVVSGINNFNQSFKARMNAIGAYAKKITSNVFNSIEKFGSTEIKFNIDGIKDRLFPDRSFEINNLKNTSVSEIALKWKELAKTAA